MTATAPQRPSAERLSAWLDSELEPTDRAEVDAWLREHPEDAAQARLWAADRDALQARFAPVADEPLPAALLHTVRSAGRGPAAWRRLAPAAGLLLGGVLLGLVAALQLQASGQWAQLASALPAWAPWADSERIRPGDWTHRAAVAHAVYTPEVRHPVEVSVNHGNATEQAAQEEHLGKWLSKRLGLTVRLFDLRAHGFDLVGGRLLPDGNGPSAQLMYQNGAGQRVTVYVRRSELQPAKASHADDDPHEIHFQRDGELGLFYWNDDGVACALVGRLPRAQLLALAEAVYDQAEQDASAKAHPPATSAPVAPARPSS